MLAYSYIHGPNIFCLPYAWMPSLLPVNQKCFRAVDRLRLCRGRKNVTCNDVTTSKTFLGRPTVSSEGLIFYP